MEDTDNSISSEQNEIDESESEALNDDLEEDESETDESDEETDASDNEEEVDYEGKKYKVPKELKEALLRQADYTRKTQEIAEARRVLQMQQASVLEEQTFQQAAIPHLAKMAALDDSINQYAQVDWQSLITNDPQEAQRHWFTYQQMKDQRQTMQGQLAQMQALFQQRTSEAMSVLLERGAAELQRDIPNFTEVAPKMIDYANKSYGISRQEIEAVTDPRYLKVLHKAYLYDQLHAKPSGEKQKPQPQTPVTNIKARSSGASKLDLVKDANKMTADEWARRREAQIRAKREKR